MQLLVRCTHHIAQVILPTIRETRPLRRATGKLRMRNLLIRWFCCKSRGQIKSNQIKGLRYTEPYMRASSSKSNLTEYIASWSRIYT